MPATPKRWKRWRLASSNSAASSTVSRSVTPISWATFANSEKCLRPPGARSCWGMIVSNTVLPTPARRKVPLCRQRSSGGGARCTERHWKSDKSRSAVGAVAKHVEHTRENPLCPTLLTSRPCPPPACREGGSQRGPAHATRIALRQHFDHDAPFVSSA